MNPPTQSTPDLAMFQLSIESALWTVYTGKEQIMDIALINVKISEVFLKNSLSGGQQKCVFTSR